MKGSDRLDLSWAASDESLKMQESLQLLQKWASSNEDGNQSIKLNLTPSQHLDLQVFQILKEAEMAKTYLICSSESALRASETQHHSLTKLQVSNQWYIWEPEITHSLWSRTWQQLWEVTGMPLVTWKGSSLHLANCTASRDWIKCNI